MENNTNMTKEDETRMASMWLLIACLNASQFALAQLEISLMKQDKKHKFRALQMAVKSFLEYMPKDDVLKEVSFDNAGAMAETVAMVAQIPTTQIDWFLAEVQKLTFAAVNRELCTK